MLESTRHSENKELYKQRRKEAISSNICQYLVRAVNSAPGWGRLKHNFITVHGTPAPLLPSTVYAAGQGLALYFLPLLSLIRNLGGGCHHVATVTPGTRHCAAHAILSLSRHQETATMLLSSSLLTIYPHQYRQCSSSHHRPGLILVLILSKVSCFV